MLSLYLQPAALKTYEYLACCNLGVMAKVFPAILEYNTLDCILKEIAFSTLLAKWLTNKQKKKISCSGKDGRSLDAFVWIKITVDQA